MKPFLKSVAEYLYKEYGNKLYSISVVFPNKRARLFFTKYLAETAGKPVFSPGYYTITEYIQEIAGDTIADQMTLLFELYETYISVTHSKESFDDFLFYCEMMLSDFDDIDKYMVDANMLYRNLSELKEIESYMDYLDDVQLKAIQQFWDTFNNSRQSEEKQKFSSIWSLLFRIYTGFKLQLSNKKIAYEGMAYRNAIEAIEKKSIELPGNIVVFVGFNALNKCEDKLFGILKNRKQALFFWDYDDYYLKRKLFHEAAYFLGDLIMKYPAPTDFSFETDLSSYTKNIKIIDIPSKIGQAKSLPGVFAGLPTDWQDNPLKTSLALADESLLIPVLSSLPQNIGEVNISMGYPIKETQIYTLISVLIDLHQKKKIQSDGKEMFYHIDVKHILQLGLFTANNQGLIESFINDIVKENRIYIDTGYSGLNKLSLNFIFKSGIKATNFLPYLLSILDEVLSLSQKGLLIISEQELEAIGRVITQLRRMNDILNESKIEYSFKSLLRLLQKILQSTTLPFSGEPLSGLQIMGLLETRVLDFENLIILSMNEGVFPKSGNVPTLVPYNLRKAFGMPTIEHQDAIFAYYFYRLIQRAKNIVLIYCSSTSDNQSGEPSRFIRQIQFENAFKKDRQTLVYSISPQLSRPVIAHKSIETRNLLINRYTAENKKALSPSAINTYLNCQFKFYLRYVANIPEPESAMEEVESNMLGTILHKTIQILYEPFIGKQTDSKSLESLLNNKVLIENALRKAFYEEYLEPGKEYNGNQPFEFLGKNIIVKEVIAQYIKHIIQYDINKAPILIDGLEFPVSFNFKLSKGNNIPVGGVIDRIEQDKNLTRIIDYKTGRVKNAFTSIEELFNAEPEKRNDAAFQTLLYSLVVSKSKNNPNTQPGLYFVREMNRKSYQSLILCGEKKDQPIENAGPFLDEFEKHLILTLEEIFATEGDFIQTQSEKFCEYCVYKTICGK